MTSDGSFREDLFYRLNIFPIKLPPLRKRTDDIPLLCYHFINKSKKAEGKDVTHISAEAMKILTANEWPGNVRQLENTIESATIYCTDSTLRPEHLSFISQRLFDEIPKTSKELKEFKKKVRAESVAEVEKAFLLNALKRNDWNITKAAADVGMQRTNFHALIKRYNYSLFFMHFPRSAVLIICTLQTFKGSIKTPNIMIYKHFICLATSLLY
jgi:DNA-binding NtrC family response regulator